MEIGADTAGGCAPGTVFPVPRRSGARPLSVLVSRVPYGTPVAFGTAAVVLISDPDATPEPSAGTLPGLFGLTRAETRMAGALLQGSTVEEYAARQSVSLNTARTHLKRIFAKTGTSRQSELVRLLLGSAAGWR